MINLLPPEEKSKLLLERKKRLVIILWILVLFFFFCLALILFAINIYSQGQVDFQKTLLQKSEEGAEQSEVKTLREKINSISLTLTSLNSFYQQKIYFSEILEKISGILPKETHLTNLYVSFDFDEQGSFIRISLSGFAATTETLLEFKDNLDKEDNFKEVYFPPVNWVKPANIDFLVTFEIH